MSRFSIPIRIIFADDHEVMREGFHAMMKKQHNLEIIGEAKNGEELLQLVSRLQPDIVITDINMPVKNGIEVSREINKLYPAVGVIAFSMSNEESQIVDMLKAGARGYILKSSSKEEVIAAVKAVSKGKHYYCRQTDLILANMRKGNNSRKIHFSEREIMIIRYICREFSSVQIGAEMNLSRRTIEGYREKILEKIEAKNTAGIVLFAVKNNIFKF